MELFKVETQADEEGRRNKVLGYVWAESTHAAAAEMYSKGKRPLYSYDVVSITSGPIYTAMDLEDYKGLIVTGGKSYNISVEKTEDFKRADLIAKLRKAGLNTDEVDQCVAALTGDNK